MKTNINVAYLFLCCLVLGLASCLENQSDLHNNKGLHYVSTGELSKAIIEFKTAARLETQSDLNKSIYLRNVALVYHDLNDRKNAIFYHKASLKLCEPNSYQYFTQKGDLYTLNHQLDSAIVYLKQAIKLSPEQSEAHNSIGLIYLGDYDLDYQDLNKALQHNKRAVQLNDSYNINHVLGRTYFELENYPEAEQVYKKMINRFPDDLDVKYLLAEAYYFQTKNSKAKTLLEEIMSVDPSYLSPIEENYMLEDLGISLE